MTPEEALTVLLVNRCDVYDHPPNPEKHPRMVKHDDGGSVTRRHDWAPDTSNPDAMRVGTGSVASSAPANSWFPLTSLDGAQSDARTSQPESGSDQNSSEAGSGA